MADAIKNISMENLKEFPDESLVKMYYSKQEFDKNQRDMAGEELMRRGYCEKENIKLLDDAQLKEINDRVRGVAGGTVTEKFVLLSKLLCSYGFFSCELKSRHILSREQELLDQIKDLQNQQKKLQDDKIKLQDQIDNLTVASSAPQTIILEKGYVTNGNRHSLTVAPEVWERFCVSTKGGLIDKGVMVSIALTRLLDDIEQGRIRFELGM